MSKKFKSQASSARAASTAFGNAGSFGFGNATSFQTSNSLLSYVTEQPDLSGISQPNVVVAFKNLFKKDSTTKEKALDELNGYVSLGSVSDELLIDDAVIDAWTTLYPRLSIDNSRRVRQLAHNFQGTLTSLSGKRIAPHLSKIIGAWLAGTFDQDRGAARAASDALQKSFNTVEKRKSLWKLYQKTLVQYIEDAATVQTAQTLSDERNTSPDDAEAKFVRVVATALGVLNALLHEQGTQTAQPVNDALSEQLKSTKLWEHAYSSDASVRRACYTLFMTTLVRRPDDIVWTIISSCFLGKGLHTDQLGSTGSFSEALLAITRTHPEAWTTEYSSKTSASKRLLRFIQRGSQRGPPSYWNYMSHLIELLPKEIWVPSPGDSATKTDLQSDSIQQIIESYRAGINNADEPRQNLRAAWESYLEVSIWLCEQLHDNETRTSALDHHVFPIIRQYVQQTAQLSKFTLPTPIAQGLCAKALAEVAARFGSSAVEDLWNELSKDLLEAVKVSQPEQSSNFRTSQDGVASQSRRFFGIAAALLDALKQNQAESMEQIINKPVQSLVEQCTRILTSRNGKPYGAANVVRDAVGFINKSDDTAVPVIELVIDFLDNQLANLIDSPSADILVKLLLELRHGSVASTRAESIMETLLDADELDAGKPAIQSLLLAMNEADLQNYPQVRQSLLKQLDAAINGDDGSWRTTATILRGQSHNAPLKMDMITRMFDGLSTESTARNSIRGFDELLGHDRKISLEQTIGTSNTSNLLSKLLVLEEMPLDSVSHDAHALTQRIRQNLEKAGLASKASLEIIRRQLSMVGEDALSIHTVVELAREALAAKGTPADESLGTILPEKDEWQKVVEPFLLDSPDLSTSVISILQGAAMMVDDYEDRPKVGHDADGFSAAVRLALFTSRLPQIMDALRHSDSSRRQAFYRYLPLVLQIINEKLNVDCANQAWTIETQEVEDEMIRLVSDGRKVLYDLITEQMKTDVLATVPGASTLESCWLNQLDSINDHSPRSFRIATAFTDILSVCIEKSGAPRYSQIWAQEIADIRKSPNPFKSAALIMVGKTWLIPLKKLCTELVVDITEAERTNPGGSVLAPNVFLNLLLDGEDAILSSLPTQRLVYLVKAVVAALDNTNLDHKDVAEMMKLLTLVLPYVASIYDEFWNDLWDTITSLTKTVESNDRAAMPFIHSATRLFALYKRLAAEETNDDLVEVWEGHVKELPGTLIKILTQFNLNNRSGTVEERHSFARNQPKSIVMSVIGRLLSTLPLDNMEPSGDVYQLLESNEREAQSASYDILHKIITDRQEQLSLDLALSKQDIHIEEQLLSLLSHVDSVENISESPQLSDARWAGPRGYLLAWKLVFDHFTRSSHKLREIYAEDIRASGSLGALLGFINDLLKISSARPMDLSRLAVDIFDFEETKNEPHVAEAQILGAHLYYLCLLYLPNLTRIWWFESKNKVKAPMEIWTQKQITPKLCKAAMTSVNEWMTSLDTSDDGEHTLEIKISPNSTELVASIPVDPEAAPVSIMISLPPAYPLQQAMVTSRNRVAVSESNWQSWLRTIRGIIMFSNGSLIDGLLAFRRNVLGALKGQTECAICYSIIGTDMKTPDKRCGTCKRLFHGVCLLRWFRSSNSSSCPLCRNNFSYA